MDDYANMRVINLRGLLREHGLRSYSGLRKTELITFFWGKLRPIPTPRLMPTPRPPSKPMPAPGHGPIPALRPRPLLKPIPLQDPYLLQTSSYQSIML